MMFENGHYLLEIKGKEITSYDGPHSSMDGVQKALYLWEQFGFVKKDRTYKMINISNMPESSSYGINKGSLALMKNILRIKDAKKKRR